MDHSKHVRLTSEEYSPVVLEGATIFETDDSKIGTVNHVHGFGPTTQVIIDVGGSWASAPRRSL